MDRYALEITKLLSLVAPYTKTGDDRLLAMCEALRRIDKKQIRGDVVECGVWRGGNIILARTLSPNRRCWLFDTFAGMTAPHPVLDVSYRGHQAMKSYLGRKKPGGKWAAVSREEVETNLIETGTFDERLLTFIEGPVEETLLINANLPEKIALLRLDTDWYASTKIELEVLYPRLQSGGILIIDDYGHWLGAQKAVREYFGDKGPKLNRIDYTAVMAVKP